MSPVQTWDHKLNDQFVRILGQNDVIGKGNVEN